MTENEIMSKLNKLGIEDIIEDYIYSTNPPHFYFALSPKIIDEEMINIWESLPINIPKLKNLNYKSFSHNEYIIEYDGRNPVKALRTTVKPEFKGNMDEILFNTFISNLLEYLF